MANKRIQKALNNFHTSGEENEAFGDVVKAIVWSFMEPLKESANEFGEKTKLASTLMEGTITFLKSYEVTAAIDPQFFM